MRNPHLKILDVSSAHLDGEARRYLDDLRYHQDPFSDHRWFEGEGRKPGIMPYRYGWLVWCDEDLDPAAPGCLAAILDAAREEYGCDFVRFDAKAGELDGFPTHEW